MSVHGREKTATTRSNAPNDTHNSRNSRHHSQLRFLMLFGLCLLGMIVSNLSLLSIYYQQFGTISILNKALLLSRVRESSLSATSTTRTNVTVVMCREDMLYEIGAVYRSLLPYLFPSDQYQVQVLDTDKAQLTQKQASSKPDVLLCNGYLYPQNYTRHKEQVGKKLGHLSIEHGRAVTRGISDIYWPDRTAIVPHRGRPFQFAFQSEAWDRGDCRYDLMIVSTDRKVFQNCGLYFWPYYASSFFRRKSWPQLLEDRFKESLSLAQAKSIYDSKTDFCAFVVAYCWDPKYQNNDIMIRPTFYDLLTERIRHETRRQEQQQQQQQPNFTLVSKNMFHYNDTSVVIKSFGRCRNTEGNTIRPKNSNQGYRDTDDVVAVFKPFRFALVFENNAVLGYITEKITNAVLADTIPIYWGAPDIARYVNMDRIVYCGEINESSNLKTFRGLPRPANLGDAETIIRTQGYHLLKDGFSSCLEEIVELERNPDKYLWKLSQPILPGNGRIEGSYFDLNKVGREMRAAMSAFDSPLVPLDPSLNLTVTYAS